MLHTNKHKRTRIIARFLIPYLIVLVFPLGIGMFVYDKTAKTIENEIVSFNSSRMDQIMEIMDRRLSEISSIGQHLTSDSKIQNFQFISSPFSGTNTYRIIDSRNHMYDYSLSNNFLFHYYVLFKNSGLVISPDATYTLSYFYDQVLHYNNESYDEWYEETLGQFHQKAFLPARGAAFMGKSYSLVTYIQSLGYPQSNQGAIIGLIDSKEIEKLLGNTDISNGGWAYIADDKGKIISYVTSDKTNKEPPRIDFANRKGVMEQTVGSKKMIIAHSTSSYNNWTYVAGQPSEVVLAKVNYIKRITLSILFVSLVLGGVAAYLFAYRNSKPLRRLVNTIMDKIEPGVQLPSDVYGLIQTKLTWLERDNDQLQSEVEAQRPFLTAAFFERLLSGQISGENEAAALLKHTGILAAGNQYGVAVLCICGYEDVSEAAVLKELDMKRYLAKTIIRTEFGNQAYTHDVGEDQVTVLFFSPFEEMEASKRELDAKLTAADRKIREQCSSRTLWGAGGIYLKVTDISRSYEEARFALHAHQRKNPIQWHSDLPSERNSYYYPLDWQVRLTNLAKSGHYEEARKLLDELYMSNFKEKTLSQTMLLLFVGMLWGTVLKLCEQTVGAEEEELLETLRSADAAKRLGEYKEIEKTFHWLAGVVKDICEMINSRKKSHNQKLVREMVDFLHQSYADPQFCLAMVAVRFGISEIYVSQFYKEQTGVNFSEYLEQTRMQRARELLRQSELTVNEIALLVGYNSFNTFGRAFKRIHGVSATAFRKDGPVSSMELRTKRPDS